MNIHLALYQAALKKKMGLNKYVMSYNSVANIWIIHAAVYKTALEKKMGLILEACESMMKQIDIYQCEFF